MRASRISSAACDLCGSNDARLVIDMPAPSLGTDGAPHNLPLQKVQCVKCGLVRNGFDLGDHDLEAHYGEDYGPGLLSSAADPMFFTERGPVSAQAALRDWIVDAVDSLGVAIPARVLEVGCSTGALMRYLQESWPASEISGIDLDRMAIAAARKHGSDVSVGTIDQVKGAFDAIISVAVMEHLSSPAEFLKAVRRRLNPGGWAAIIVPVQDKGNRDIFFCDHLFHFHSEHVAALGAGASLQCIFQDSAHPLHEGYGLSLMIPMDAPQSTELAVSEYARGMDVDAVVTRWRHVFARLNDWLESLGSRRPAVYGLGESFDFLWAYTALRKHPPVFGMDDNITRASARVRDFPVVGPSESQMQAADALLLTFKPGANLRSILKDVTKPIFILE